MCLIFFAHQAHPRFPLIVAANRDENYVRATAAAGFWDDGSGILAGRDLEAGGTWLGMTRHGRFAALTNFRQPGSVLSAAPSRGALVSNYLHANGSPLAYTGRLVPDAAAYNGFNLLIGDLDDLVWYSNRGDVPRLLPPGVYGLSNHLLDTPWPKVEAGKALFRDALAAPEPNLEALYELLASRALPPAESLPDTGVGREREQVLAPAFILSDSYGTRSSTVISRDLNGHVIFSERTFAADGSPNATVAFEFEVSV